MSGPTTTGSIDAKLTVDDSDFKRGMAEAKAEAKEVGALEPTVKVDANVGPALAKLDAVAIAERNLDVAFQRSAIAQEKLSAVTKKYGDDSIQAASARLTLTRATHAESDAEAKLAGLKHQSTVAQDAETESTKRAVQANNRRVSGLQILIALSPAILTAAAPIAGAAVGLGVAFGVMGVSGVLAIKGIKDEMAHGSAVGNQYAAGLGALKVDLNQLSQTSAVAMLGSFNSSVGDINARMPFLNQMVGEGSSLLGAMGGTALSGVLTGLQQMNPLIQQGGVELGKFVTWLFSFTGTNGFNEFLAYASANLPAVMTLIESLVTTSGHLLAAFAPLGPVVIGVLTALSDGLSSLPLPVLAGLVTTATTLGPALKGAFSVAPLITSVAEAIGFTGVMANLAVPAVGILLAAIAGLGMMAATAATAQEHNTASVQNYTQALRDDTNAIGEHVRAQAAKALADSGAVGAARTLGVSIEDVTAAAEGNADAQARVAAVTDAATKASIGGVAGHRTATQAQIEQGDAAKTLADAVNGTNGAINDGIQKNKDYDAAIAASKSGIDANTRAAEAQAGQYGVSVGMYQQAKDAQDKAKQSTEAQTLAMQLQNDAAGLLKQAFDALNGKVLGVEQTQTRAASATNSVSKSFAQNGLAIQGTTDAAIANQQALQNKVTADQAAADAVAKATGSTEEGTKAYAASKVALEEQLKAQGLLTPAVQDYITKLYGIPAVAKTQIEIDKAKAEADLAAFQAMIAAATARRTQYIDIITNRLEQSTKDPQGTGSSVGGRANGSLAGGVETGGLIHAGFSAASPAYLSEGGSPFVPRGTDTVPAMLTPGEIVMKRASVNSLGAGNLLEANRTGQWPGQGGKGSQPVTVNLILDGRIIDSRIVDIASGTADQRIAAADSRSQYLRKGR